MDVSCLPITGENGKFVSSIAMRDIQEIFTSKQHDMMYSEMHDFVVYMSNKSTENHNCIVVQKTCTFSHAIQNMTKTKQHCVWVVDEKSRPVGVLSISDVITYLCSS